MRSSTIVRQLSQFLGGQTSERVFHLESAGVLDLLLVTPPVRSAVLQPEDLRGRVRRNVLDRLYSLDALLSAILTALYTLLGVVVAECSLE